ncbi:MAG: hypothetical protein JSR46_02805, partial [Verrucomicrobia bacterium]|nr:hypothetical protein [Verrucomicrobiota bacterium]
MSNSLDPVADVLVSSASELPNTIYPVVDEFKPTVQQGLFYGLRQAHVLALRQQNGLPTTFSRNLSTTPQVEAEVKEILTSLTKPVAAAVVDAEEAPFTQEMNTLKTLVSKLPEEDAEKGQKLLEVCQNQIQTAAEKGTPKEVTKELFGQFIFLLDTDPKKAIELATANYRIWSMQSWVNDAFSKKIDALNKTLLEAVKAEHALGIMDTAAYRTAQLPKEMAKLLIASTGFFNDAIADALIKKLFVKGEHSHQNEIKQNLEKYKTDPTLRELLKAVKAPSSPELDSNTLVRHTLDLASSTPVDDVQAQRAHLAGQLASLGDETVSTMPKVLRTLHLNKCGVDLNDIIQNSCIERKVDGQPTVFRFTLDGDEKTLSKAIEIDANGNLLNGYGSIDQSIALRKTAREMGIEEEKISGLVKSLAIVVFQRDQAITPKTLIAELAKTFSEAEVAKKTLIGNAAFCSLTCNPLLQAWDNSIDAMGSHRAKARHQAKIVQSVQAALYNKFKAENANVSSYVKELFNNFVANLNSNITLKLNDDSSSFVISNANTAEQFTAFVLHALDTAIHSGASAGLSELAMDGLVAVTSKVGDYIKSNSFLRLALANFHTDNEGVARSEDPLDELEFLPWRAPYDNNHFEFLATYFEQDAEKVAELTPDSAKTLLGQLLEVGRTNNQANEMIAITSAQHTSTLLLNHPSFAGRNVAEKSIEECLAAYAAEFNAD